jgi:hypothetical protein
VFQQIVTCVAGSDRITGNERPEQKSIGQGFRLGSKAGLSQSLRAAHLPETVLTEAHEAQELWCLGGFLREEEILSPLVLGLDRWIFGWSRIHLRTPRSRGHVPQSPGKHLAQAVGLEPDVLERRNELVVPRPTLASLVRPQV